MSPGPSWGSGVAGGVCRKTLRGAGGGHRGGGRGSCKRLCAPC